MKNFLLLLLLGTLVVGTTGCLKSNDVDDCTTKSASVEAPAIQAYAAANSYTVTAHSSGLYYQVVNPGSGPLPTLDSKVFVRYTGRLVSTDMIFDQQSNHLATGWTLGSLIPGWQLGLPLIAEGGTIRLIIPSALGYGCRGYGTIPGDAILFFDIELVDVQ